ncbi:hypothetical protein [Candidatus Magnetominusculus dajiuhuensis]|uniref:hypothetical protein n=1 Tax=Candidatus Magnetominusculus dajiuhuensis TaxID=3137712 RepID=UPI003B43109B
MPATLPIELYDLLEKKVGREDAREVGKLILASFDAIDKRAETVVIQKKAEIKEELTKELANKEDLAKLEGRLSERISSLEGKINEKFTDMNWRMKVSLLIILFVILLTNPKALDLIAKLFGLVK